MIVDLFIGITECPCYKPSKAEDKCFVGCRGCRWFKGIHSVDHANIPMIDLTYEEQAEVVCTKEKQVEEKLQNTVAIINTKRITKEQWQQKQLSNTK